MKYILGIDQGTTQTTAVVVDENASFVEKNSVPLPARFPSPGWVEQDPMVIWKDTLACAKHVAKGADIIAIGITNQRETLVT